MSNYGIPAKEGQRNNIPVQVQSCLGTFTRLSHLTMGSATTNVAKNHQNHESFIINMTQYLQDSTKSRGYQYLYRTKGAWRLVIV
jgi:hypothetical protein